MKVIGCIWILLAGIATAFPESLETLRRQVQEQERQIKRLEIENARLRYMLTEADEPKTDPLYGAKVSGKPAAAKGGSEGRAHVVREGDTLSKIASTHGVELDAVLEANRIPDPSRIAVGQRIVMPGPDASLLPKLERAERRTHVVQSGENLYRISLRYGVDLDDLLAANPAVDPRRLRVGQKISVPTAETALAAGR
ncbi:peptidoglycan-binding protein lysM [Haloferula helveola]|uniref:Peptidoglycan-binding protein lysM n=1 Tax=Haloferula helveola TaxID=490095 RepID=A0ABN6GYM3_9BACT|nr:peptidoglycan-binding protein lysM [Haloferula helveola]